MSYLRDSRQRRTWIEVAKPESPDWSIFQIADGREPAELLSTDARVVEADPWTIHHLEVESIFRYPFADSHFDLRHRVWLYPGVAGARVQIGLRPGRGFDKDELPSFIGGGSHSQRLWLHDTDGLRRRAAGYYNDTQHRNFDHLPLLHELHADGPLPPREIYDWASLLCLGDDRGTLLLVKESHKCINQDGLDTGAFVLDPASVTVTGLGYENTGNAYEPSKKYCESGVFRDAWATWIIPARPAPEQQRLALKRFDRARFNPRPEQNLRIRANTWGTRGAGDASREAATEANILREIDACADVGVEQVCIDDGWQHDPRGARFTEGQGGWRPNPQRFPSGWTAVRERADRRGIGLALWNSWSAAAEDMIRNYDAADFEMFKVDFVNIKSRDDL